MAFQPKSWFYVLLFALTAVMVFLLGLFGASVVERRSEANQLLQPVKTIAEWEPRNEVWGQNYPREYETYKATFDTTFASLHGGSATIDMLERYPQLVVLWAGYSFSRDYKQSRGHYHAVEDIRNTLRTAVEQPGTCWSCKSTDVPRLMSKVGPADFYKAKWEEWGKDIQNNIGCQDCHDPQSMNLRITRPALIEAYQRRGKNIQDATHQEMRSQVCAQCHVEYYFKGKTEKYLTFPWDQGSTAEEIEKYYDQVEHVDWVHQLSRAPMLKAQHPDWELFQLGIHFQRGLACADCHMPYRSEGGVKFTNHKISSPLENVAGSCGVCHRESETALIQNVYERQDKVRQLMGMAEDLLTKAHIETKAALDHAASPEQLVPIQQLIRQAQWRWDFVAASHGGSFHAPLECSRILGHAIEKASEARRLLALLLIRLGAPLPAPMPDLSTKAKAQQYIGLDMARLEREKNLFKKNVLPQWIAAGR
ncbi:MAG TPA: ammonia-forming cytochrome c nitrite reductase subunit c552 [bacterium]|nr:ammonia-forming cytochrome c nitrite reductase subunit c552 [bacterium]HPN33433.1 ammonia-forming cytochrome c nitrite reductase subunit c552 [bacterium]